MFAKLRIGKIQTYISPFIPTFSQAAVFVAFPPAMPFRQEIRMSIPVPDFGNQDDVRIQVEKVPADFPAGLNALGCECFGKPYNNY